jgi:hypothetical protein
MLISMPRCLKGFPYLCATAAYEQQQRPDHRQFDVTAPRILPPKQCLISRLMSLLLDQEMYVRERYKDPFMLCLQMTIPLLFTLYTVSKAGRIQGVAGAAIIHVNPLLAICNSEYTADTVRQKGCPRSACRCHSRPYNASSMLAL